MDWHIILYWMCLVHDGYKHCPPPKGHKITIDYLGTGLPLPTFPVDCSKQPHGDSVLQRKGSQEPGRVWAGTVVSSLKSWNHQSFNSWKFDMSKKRYWFKKCMNENYAGPRGFLPFILRTFLISCFKYFVQALWFHGCCLLMTNLSSTQHVGSAGRVEDCRLADWL